MKIQQQKKTKRITPLIIVLFSILLLAGAVMLYLYLNRNSSDKTSTGANSTSESVHKSDNEQAQNLRDDPTTKQQAPNTDKPSEPTTSDTSNKQQVQLTASTDTSGSTVYIRGGVNYPVSGGSCYALLTGPSGQSIRKNTTVLQNPASTDCKTISISTNELSSGKWSFILYYTSDNYEGASDEVSFSI